MKAEVIQEKFSQALNHINKAISGKPNIPVLNNVLLVAEKGKIKLSSTNLEIGINASIGADIEEEGKITVSAKLLSEFVSTMKPGKIKIAFDGKKFVVNSVDNSAEFFVIPADDFPDVPKASGEPILKFNSIDFAAALDKTTFAASNDNSRPVLTGLLFKITKRKLSIVALDGFRLSQKIIDIEGGPEEDFKEIIPSKSLQEVGKIIKDVCTDKEDIEIYTMKSKNQIIFKIGEIELASRLIEGEFPPYEDILPKGKQHSFSVLKSELSDVVKIVSIFARNVVGNKSRFKVDMGKKKLTLSAEVVDIGKNDASADIAKTMGEDIESAYNAKFLQDMINSIESDEIIYETNGTTSPGIFLDGKDKSFIHVIMPMILN